VNFPPPPLYVWRSEQPPPPFSMKKEEKKRFPQFVSRPPQSDFIALSFPKTEPQALLSPSGKVRENTESSPTIPPPKIKLTSDFFDAVASKEDFRDAGPPHSLSNQTNNLL